LGFLANAIQQGKLRLKSLNLEDNKIFDDGAIKLADAFRNLEK
jgi:hypothetical protein